MADREKVLKGLECCSESISKACPMECPYRVECLMQDDTSHMYSVMHDALELLKEQEPIKPTYEDFLGNRVARCGKCNGYIVRYKYCPGCGQAVKWE